MYSPAPNAKRIGITTLLCKVNCQSFIEHIPIPKNAGTSPWSLAADIALTFNQ